MVKLFGKSYLSKRGSLQDIILMGVFVLIFGMITLISFKVVTELNTIFQANAVLPDASKNVSTRLLGFFPGIIDNTFLFFVIGLAIVVIVLAALVRVHPIFIPFFFIAWVFLIFISGILSNIYQAVAANAEFIGLANQLTFITNVLTLLPMFVGIFGIILMVIMYKSWQVAQG